MNWLRYNDPTDDHLGGAQRTPPPWRVLGNRAVVAGLVLLILAVMAGVLAMGCAPRLDVDVPPIAPPSPPVLPPVAPPASATPAAAATPAADEVARLRADLAAAEIRAEREAAQARADERTKRQAPLVALLSWGLLVGGAVALLGAVALGLSFSRWVSWIPGGRGTALAVIASGIGLIALSIVLAEALDYAWLLIAAAALGVVVVVVWIAFVAIRQTAAHGDRVAPATTDDERQKAGEQSAFEQSRAGVRGVINFARKWGRK
jgi:hypothetical protein